ncbi:solute carrier family 12 member 9-like isoform X2 [Apostichopus japonicus]|uniref:solute carrier family 12 member 9-like isoform X2 n=1 Tax=Stichopus japonicus TaxID=307972 RepID=UPI003AB3CE66
MADSKGQRLLLFDLDESIRYSKFDNSVEGVAPSPKPKPKEDSTKLSMMIGVFLPCILAIFSGILFLRLGFAVGQGGVLESFGMFLLGYCIVTLTSLSLSAISTNGAVEGGGAYFMISRALGPELGGSIGVMFFIASIFSSSLYCIGFTEALTDNFGETGFYTSNSTFQLPAGQWYTFAYNSAVLFVCLLVCIIGAQMFAKTQLIIFLTVMASIISSIVSFVFAKPDLVIGYTGFNVDTFRDNLFSNYTIDHSTMKVQSFVSVFAVIFNGCVGIMAGANLSGELKNPSKAIPVGTLGALAYTGLIYIFLIFLIAFTCTRELLLDNYNFLQYINLCPVLVAIGIFASTLSAALSALIGASRVLIALANDSLFGPILWPVQKLVTKSGNPIGAVLVSWLLAEAMLLIGELNTIASLVSIFFLLSYAAVNLACLALDLASAPNFRPSFKYFSWHTSSLGMIGCLVMMFLIDVMWASVSVVIFMILILVVYFRTGGSQWGYISQALIFHQVRKYLLLLDTRKDHVKFWRPQILLLVANPRSSCNLIKFVNDMKKSGLYVLGHVQQGSVDEFPTDPVERELPAWVRLVEVLKVKAFIELTLAHSVREGAQHLIRVSGLGGMKPNMVVMGFYDEVLPEDSLFQVQNPRRGYYGTVAEDTEGGNALLQLPPLRAEGEDKLLSREEYVCLILDIVRLKKGVCLARNFHNFNREDLALHGRKNIDIWPVNFLKPETAGYFDTACIFLLQVACVVHMVPLWKKHTQMRVFLCVDSDYASTNHKKEKLKKFLTELRIKAEIVTVPWNHITVMNRSEEADNEMASNLVTRVSEDYLQALNSMVRDHADNTAIVFSYLPMPPVDRGLHGQYLHEMDLLTRDLPPTMMVHGLGEVTLTTM